MTRRYGRKAETWKAVLCVLLAAVFATTSLSMDSIAVYAKAEERTFDIGVNAESVTAVLGTDGVLTVSGSGEIRDFTPQTSPFREVSQQITTVKLGADIVSIGDCLFYNCENLTGQILLPARLVRIGSRAFSGDSAALAPKPDFVNNPFQEAMVTRKKEETPKEGEASPAPSGLAALQPPPEPSFSPEPDAAPEPETDTKPVKAENRAAPVSDGEASSLPAASEESQPAVSPAAPAPEREQEESAPPTGTASPSPTPSPSPVAEDGNRYLVETITQQEIGAEIFYPCEAGEARAFSCSAANGSFRAAMLAAGYTESEGSVTAAFDCGEGVSSTVGTVTRDLPLLQGGVVLPAVLPEFSAPQGGELFSYTFGGWTEAEDEANTARPAGSFCPAQGRSSLYFIANWNREVLVKILVERSGNALKLSVPEIEGYDATAFRWQTCLLSDGQELPADQELLPWEDIPEEAARAYERRLRQGDENRLFRCVVTVTKRQSFLRALFSLSGPEELALGAVRGMMAVSAEDGYRITCERGSYRNGAAVPGGGDPEPVLAEKGDYAVIPSCPYTPPASADGTVVFNGWLAGDGTAYDPGDMVRLTGDVNLTAQWEKATIVYLNGSGAGDGADSAAGASAASPRKFFSGYTENKNTYYGVYDLFSGGTKYTNIIVVCGDTQVGPGNGWVPASTPATITNADPSTGTKYDGVLNVTGVTCTLQADTVFRDIRINGNGTTDGAQAGASTGIFGGGHKLRFGENVATNGQLIVGGGQASALNGSTDLVVQSGTYAVVYGGNREGGGITGNTRLSMSGGSAKMVIGGLWYGGNITGGTEVLLGGTAQADAVAGGSRDSKEITVDSTHVVVGGRAVVGSAASPGSVSGGGYDAVASANTVSIQNGTSVEIRGRATVYGDVFGASGDMYSGGSGTTDLCSILGTAKVEVAGQSTVTGSVYGGGNNRSVRGGTEVVISGGSVGGDVYGGGSNGHIFADTAAGFTGNTIVKLQGGAVAGNLFGGGHRGNVDGACAVEAAGGTVGKNVYGGGDQGTVGSHTAVSVSGGAVFGHIFGGSKGTADHPDTGAVGGNASVEITGGELGTYTGSAGESFDQATGSVYGGGEFARVAGDSSVTVHVASDSGGHPAVGGSVYGGGSRAQVGQKSRAYLASGRVGGSVYGGGYGADSTSAGTEVSVSGGAVGNHVYGGGAEGRVTGETSVTISGGTMRGVFAAGEGNEASSVDTGRVNGPASVTVSGGTVAGGVYGGGYLGLVGSGSDPEADASVRDGQTTVTVTGGTVDRVFGGGSGSGSDPTFGSVFGNTQVSVTGGTVTGNVYGGSNYAYVTGNTQVSLKAAAGAVSVGGSVFGGGNLNRSPEDGFDNNSFLVLGNSSVLLDGAGLSIAGSVLCSGNLTRVQGTKTLKIQDFTGELRSIQRTTRTELLNSQVTLLGADDVTDDQGSKLFSLTKVDDLRLTGSTLRLEAEARELGALGNYDETGSVSSRQAGRSTVQVVPGLLLQVAPSAEAGGSGNYGPVSGVLWLEMTQKPTGGRGVRVEADETSEIGDGSADTGAFQRKDSDTNAGLEMISGSVSGSHRFWRLGGSVLERKVTIEAVKTAAGGQSVAHRAFQLPTATGSTVYQITSMKKVAGDFTLVKAGEDAAGNMTLPSLDAGQSADDTFALRVMPTDSGNRGTWENLEANQSQWASYLMTQLPPGESAWNSGVSGVWRRGSGNPTTVSTGEGAGNDAEFTFSLAYDSSYESFSGGELEITYQEYRAGGAMDDTALENTVVVKLTLEGEQGGASQKAYAAKGRRFADIAGSEPVSILPAGAVTAKFLTKYYPAAAGAENIYLCLCSGTGDAAESVPLPAGTRIVLADMTAPGAYRYYFCRTSGTEQKLSLAGFTSLGSGGSMTYPGPSDNTAQISEKLLFAVDFSGVEDTARLAQGEYSLHLTHSAGEEPLSGAPARFSVTAAQEPTLDLKREENATADTAWGIALTPHVAEADTRYADGAGVRLTLTGPDGSARSFPDKVAVTGGAQNVLQNGDGSISFALPASGRSVVTLDFSSVPESMFPAGEYQVHAALRPRAGLQVGSNQGAADASPAPLSFALTRAQRAERSINATLNDASQRLADASQQAAVLNFTLEYRGLQEGDHLEAVLLQKTGSTPDSGSYTPLADSSQWLFTPSPGELAGSGGALQVTVPQGTPSGTYRVLFRLLDSSGGPVAEQPYNFIVK